jgi:putative hemolysin
MNPLVYIGIITICLALSAFFSGSETALLRLRKDEVDRDVEDRKGLSVLAARELLRSTSRLLITILLGNNVVNILAASSASALAIHYLGEKEGITVATIIMTMTILIFAEVLPKAVAARNARMLAYFVAMPLYVIHQCLKPVHFVFHKLIDPIIQRIAGKDQSEALETLDQLLYLARQVEPNHDLQGSPALIIAHAANAQDLSVGQIMIPRTEIFCASITDTCQEVFDEALKERYTRIPVYEGSIDHVLGVVHFKDLAKSVAEKNDDLGKILKPILRVPEKKPILPLLQDMQKGFIHLAIVKDEFGVTQGMVTQEDILEEIVGEIRDEFDREELEAIKKIGDDTVKAFGRVLIHDFNRQTGWNIDAEPGETLSGLIFNKLGRAPHENDIVRVPGYAIQVLDISGTRITRVKVIKEPIE